MWLLITSSVSRFFFDGLLFMSQTVEYNNSLSTTRAYRKNVHTFKGDLTIVGKSSNGVLTMHNNRCKWDEVGWHFTCLTVVLSKQVEHPISRSRHFLSKFSPAEPVAHGSHETLIAAS